MQKPPLFEAPKSFICFALEYHISNHFQSSTNRWYHYHHHHHHHRLVHFLFLIMITNAEYITITGINPNAIMFNIFSNSLSHLYSQIAINIYYINKYKCNNAKVTRSIFYFSQICMEICLQKRQLLYK